MSLSAATALVLAALNSLVVADWDGLMQDTDVIRQPAICHTFPIVYGGQPSDSEWEELCNPANTFPCDSNVVVLYDNGPGSITYVPHSDVDCVIAGPRDFDDCKGAFTNCISKSGGLAGPANMGVTCYVRNGDDTVVASIGVTAACQPPILPP